MQTSAIDVDHVSRTYRNARGLFCRQAAVPDLVALDDVTLSVQPGELFGLLGPNGAGKTTLIKILTTLLTPTTGLARVDGFDVVRQAHEVRQRINMVSGGEGCGYGVLTVRENLWMFSQLYGIPTREARKRIDALLAIVDLAEKADTKISHLSTGMRQKMNLCRALVTEPKILFLDEPTIGLDVTAARKTRQFLRQWMAERAERTILLTTHYMMEADELCDRVAIIDRGKVLACDSPASLKQGLRRHPRYELVLQPGTNGWQEIAGLPGVLQYACSAGPSAIECKIMLEEEAAIGSVMQHVTGAGACLLSLKKIEPSLEDVFINMVGHGLAEEDKS